MSEEKVLNEGIDSNWKVHFGINEQLSEDGKIKVRGD